MAPPMIMFSSMVSHTVYFRTESIEFLPADESEDEKSSTPTHNNTEGSPSPSSGSSSSRPLKRRIVEINNEISSSLSSSCKKKREQVIREQQQQHRENARSPRQKAQKRALEAHDSLDEDHLGNGVSPRDVRIAARKVGKKARPTEGQENRDEVTEISVPSSPTEEEEEKQEPHPEATDDIGGTDAVDSGTIFHPQLQNTTLPAALPDLEVVPSGVEVTPPLKGLVVPRIDEITSRSNSSKIGELTDEKPAITDKEALKADRLAQERRAQNLLEAFD